MKRSKDLMLFGANENQHIFKGLLLFLYVYIGASLFASIFTPLAFWLVEWVNANSPCQLTEYLMRKKITIYYFFFSKENFKQILENNSLLRDGLIKIK